MVFKGEGGEGESLALEKALALMENTETDETSRYHSKVAQVLVASTTIGHPLAACTEEEADPLALRRIGARCRACCNHLTN